jgi:hypothetical protein
MITYRRSAVKSLQSGRKFIVWILLRISAMQQKIYLTNIIIAGEGSRVWRRAVDGWDLAALSRKQVDDDMELASGETPRALLEVSRWVDQNSPNSSSPEQDGKC